MDYTVDRSSLSLCRILGVGSPNTEPCWRVSACRLSKTAPETILDHSIPNSNMDISEAQNFRNRCGSLSVCRKRNVLYQ
jgi:hypothetical protein